MSFTCREFSQGTFTHLVSAWTSCLLFQFREHWALLFLMSCSRSQYYNTPTGSSSYSNASTAHTCNCGDFRQFKSVPSGLHDTHSVCCFTLPSSQHLRPYISVIKTQQWTSWTNMWYGKGILTFLNTPSLWYTLPTGSQYPGWMCARAVKYFPEYGSPCWCAFCPLLRLQGWIHRHVCREHIMVTKPPDSQCTAQDTDSRGGGVVAILPTSPQHILPTTMPVDGMYIWRGMRKESSRP